MNNNKKIVGKFYIRYPFKINFPPAYLKGKVTEKERPSTCWFSPDMPNTASTIPGQSQEIGLLLGLPQGRQMPKHLKYYLLSPRRFTVNHSLLETLKLPTHLLFLCNTVYLSDCLEYSLFQNADFVFGHRFFCLFLLTLRSCQLLHSFKYHLYSSLFSPLSPSVEEFHFIQSQKSLMYALKMECLSLTSSSFCIFLLSLLLYFQCKTKAPIASQFLKRKTCKSS